MPPLTPEINAGSALEIWTHSLRGKLSPKRARDLLEDTQDSWVGEWGTHYIL